MRDIRAAHVIGVLEPIWTTKTETASRVRSRIELVLDYATARGYREGLNAARWKGNLDAARVRGADGHSIGRGSRGHRSEIDLDAALWITAAARMKSGREHRVPLSMPALQLLRSLNEDRVPEDNVFPGMRGPLSDMSLTAVLRRMKVAATAHGFRSTFRDWVSEHTEYSGEVAEMALSHERSAHQRRRA